MDRKHLSRHTGNSETGDATLERDGFSSWHSARCLALVTSAAEFRRKSTQSEIQTFSAESFLLPPCERGNESFLYVSTARAP